MVALFTLISGRNKSPVAENGVQHPINRALQGRLTSPADEGIFRFHRGGGSNRWKDTSREAVQGRSTERKSSVSYSGKSPTYPPDARGRRPRRRPSYHRPMSAGDTIIPPQIYRDRRPRRGLLPNRRKHRLRRHQAAPNVDRRSNFTRPRLAHLRVENSPVIRHVKAAYRRHPGG